MLRESNDGLNDYIGKMSVGNRMIEWVIIKIDLQVFVWKMNLSLKALFINIQTYLKPHDCCHAGV